MSHIQVTRNNLTFSIHKAYSENIDEIVKNQKNDWDFKLAISGDGMTRTGKSTMGIQTCIYGDETFLPNWKTRIIFDGATLIKTAYEVPKGSWLMYDEAREGLDAKKQMERYTKNLLDFFSQCGNLNLTVIIILPEFFELPKSIAISQTIALINCYCTKGFTRGYFDFFNRRDKRYLYIQGQKYLEYQAQRPSFKGTFTKFFPINKQEYEDLKNKTLQDIKKRENYTEVKEQQETEKIRVKILIKYLMKQLKIKPAFIGELLGIARTTVYHYFKEDKPKK